MKVVKLHLKSFCSSKILPTLNGKTKLEQNTTQIEWRKQLSLLHTVQESKEGQNSNLFQDRYDANSSLPVSYWPNDPPCIQL